MAHHEVSGGHCVWGREIRPTRVGLGPHAAASGEQPPGAQPEQLIPGQAPPWGRTLDRTRANAIAQMNETITAIARAMVVAKALSATGGCDGGAGPRQGVLGRRRQSGRQGGCGGGFSGDPASSTPLPRIARGSPTRRRPAGASQAAAARAAAAATRAAAAAGRSGS